MKFARDFCRRGTFWVRKHYLLVLFLYAFLFAGGLYLALTQLGMNTDLSDMISEDLEFHRRWKEYKSEFPQLNDTILVVIRGKNYQSSDRVAAELKLRLEKSSQFKRVFRLNGGEYFDRYGLLLDENFESEELQELNQLSWALSRNPHLVGLYGILGRLEFNSETRQLWTELSETLELASTPNVKALDFFSDPRREKIQFVEIYPQLDFSQLLPAESAILELRSVLDSLENEDVSFEVTGVAALAYEELQSVSAGASLAGLLSLVLVAVILFIALRSWSLIFISLSTLILGLVLSAAFAALSVGHLNLISVAFAVLFIGLGIDYSIHIGLRYRELMQHGYSHDESISLCMQEMGSSLFLCTLTTSAGFFAFVPTAYAGVSELGIIAGAGMIINFLIHLTFFPALLEAIKPRFGTDIRMESSPGAWISIFSFKYYRWIRWGAGALALVSIPFVLQVDFDPNPLNLQDPHTEAYQSYQKLLSQSDRSPWTIKIVEDSEEELRELVSRLEKIPEVSQVIWAGSFIPSDQDSKIRTIDGLRWPEKIKTQDLPVLMSWNSLGRFENQIEEKKPTSEDDQLLKMRFLSALENFREHFKGQEASGNAWLKQHWLEPLIGDLHQFSDRLPSRELDLVNLPSDIRDRYISENGKYRIEVFPSENISDVSKMREFAEAVQKVEIRATDDPVTLPLSGDAVVQAFLQASTLSIVIIFILIWAITRSIRESLFVMLPIFFASLVLKATMTVAGISFNFANIIVLPLLLGIGVDSGIHLVHRLKVGRPEESLGGSSSRGVFYSAITTIFSFGTLIISTHRGTSSMGLLLTLGTLLVMISTLSLIPALIRRARAI